MRSRFRLNPRRKRGPRTLKLYIHKVLKQVHHNMSISEFAMKIINSQMEDLADRIIAQAMELLEISQKLTISSRDIQTAVRLVLAGDLATHAVSEGTKAVSKFCAEKNNRENHVVKSASAKAGLQFPIPRFKAMIAAKSKARVGSGAATYLAAVCEYVSAEILELAGNSARDNQHVRITPRDVMIALRNDQELIQLFPGCVPSAGVIVSVHPFLTRG